MISRNIICDLKMLDSSFSLTTQGDRESCKEIRKEQNSLSLLKRLILLNPKLYILIHLSEYF